MEEGEGEDCTVRRVEYKADMEHGFQVEDLSTVILYLLLGWIVSLVLTVASRQSECC